MVLWVARENLSLWDFPRTQFSHNSRSLRFLTPKTPCLHNSTIPFMLMCPNLLCHSSVTFSFSSETALSPTTVAPSRTYKPCFNSPFITTIIPLMTFNTPPWDLYEYPLVSNMPSEIRFLLRSGICLTFSRTLTEPSHILSLTFPIPTTLHDMLLPIRTVPPSSDSYSKNQSLLGVI